MQHKEIETDLMYVTPFLGDMVRTGVSRIRILCVIKVFHS